MQDEARRAFSNLLERAAASEQVKSVVALLKRYEGLFQLPSRIRQGTERGEYDQVRIPNPHLQSANPVIQHWLCLEVTFSDLCY